VSVPRISPGDTERILLFRIADAERRGSRIQNLQPFPVDSPEYEHIRFFHGLLLGLAISAVLWAALAAVGYGTYLLIVAA
jgi:hypothetical protein